MSRRLKNMESPALEHIHDLLLTYELNRHFAHEKDPHLQELITRSPIQSTIGIWDDEYRRMILQPAGEGVFNCAYYPISQQEAENDEEGILWSCDIPFSDMFPVTATCQKGDVFNHDEWTVEIVDAEEIADRSPLQGEPEPYKTVFFKLSVDKNTKTCEDTLDRAASVDYMHPLSEAQRTFKKRVKALGFSPIRWETVRFGIKYTFPDFVITLYHNEKQQTISLVFDRGCPKAVVESFEKINRPKVKVTS